MTNPDDDLTAKKLELALAESNLAMHEEHLNEAASLADAALEDLSALPKPADHVGALLVAQASATLAGAISSVVQTRLMLEHERSAISHSRAHVDHAEAEIAKQGEVKDRVSSAMEALRHQLEAEGIRIVPGMFGDGVMGIQLGEPDD